ncbi:SoxR reducing system RseC family protein [Niveibacterium microcysteis]|uniref:SoxR reducing system RseC family protein n=1 Tax=Niveibacterium microcysteis TaxID=2811415 RepID=A0ABX7M1Y3_9RHOO|nr:SoxR reducing system RseC family protein [Niveibacterium microcysteis]QSI75765.1 SoxR reducing system RseC family protein [Niveibacterium microcysteis]
MNTRKAIVLRVEGATAVVKVGGDGGCGRCSETGGCGSDVLGKLFGGRCSSYSVVTDRPLTPGSEVEVAVEPRAPLLAATLAYGLPLLGLLVGGAIGEQYVGDTGAVLGAALGLAAFSVGAAFLARRRLAGGLAVRVVESSISH